MAGELDEKQGLEPKGLDPKDLNLVTFIEQQYRITGKLLSADQAFSDYAIPKDVYSDTLNKPEVKQALAERGIVFERFNDDWTAHSLTPQQLVVANTILDLTDTRTIKKKLQDLGINTRLYDAWLKDPVFKAYMHTRAEQMIGDSKHDVDTALLDKVRSGDLKAIEFYYEYTGRFTRARATTGVDVSQLIVKIIEIIDEEVDDPQVLRRLSDRIKGAIAARNTANALIGDDDDAIVIPQVVKSRPLNIEPAEVQHNDAEQPRAIGL